MDLMQTYGKRYKVSRSDDGENSRGQYEIIGKRGYIRPFGANLELYISSSVIAKRIERTESAFKAKNHYLDATAFEFKDAKESVSKACKWIKAKNRRQITPEQREIMAARLRSLKLKPHEERIS